MVSWSFILIELDKDIVCVCEEESENVIKWVQTIGGIYRVGDEIEILRIFLVFWALMIKRLVFQFKLLNLYLNDQILI
jgi:hypothetical protein